MSVVVGGTLFTCTHKHTHTHTHTHSHTFFPKINTAICTYNIQAAHGKKAQWWTSLMTVGWKMKTLLISRHPFRSVPTPSSLALYLCAHCMMLLYFQSCNEWCLKIVIGESQFKLPSSSLRGS